MQQILNFLNFNCFSLYFFYFHRSSQANVDRFDQLIPIDSFQHSKWLITWKNLFLVHLNFHIRDIFLHYLIFFTLQSKSESFAQGSFSVPSARRSILEPSITFQLCLFYPDWFLYNFIRMYLDVLNCQTTIFIHSSTAWSNRHCRCLSSILWSNIHRCLL